MTSNTSDLYSFLRLSHSTTVMVKNAALLVFILKKLPSMPQLYMSMIVLRFRETPKD